MTFYPTPHHLLQDFCKKAQWRAKKLRERGSNAARPPKKGGGGLPSASQSVAIGRNRSLLVAIGRDWSRFGVVIGRAARRDWSSCASCNRSQSVATGRYWSCRRRDWSRFGVVIGRADPLPKTRHKKSRMPESIQAFGCACRDA